MQDNKFDRHDIVEIEYDDIHHVGVVTTQTDDCVEIELRRGSVDEEFETEEIYIRAQEAYVLPEFVEFVARPDVDRIHTMDTSVHNHIEALGIDVEFEDSDEEILAELKVEEDKEPEVMTDGGEDLPSGEDEAEFSKYDIETLKEFLELTEKYEETHEYNEYSHEGYFWDDLAGMKIPFKYHKSGKYAGESCLNTKLYKTGTENGGYYHELRSKFSTVLYLVTESMYESVEQAVRLESEKHGMKEETEINETRLFSEEEERKIVWDYVFALDYPTYKDVAEKWDCSSGTISNIITTYHDVNDGDLEREIIEQFDEEEPEVVTDGGEGLQSGDVLYDHYDEERKTIEWIDSIAVQFDEDRWPVDRCVVDDRLDARRLSTV